MASSTGLLRTCRVPGGNWPTVGCPRGDHTEDITILIDGTTHGSAPITTAGCASKMTERLGLKRPHPALLSQQTNRLNHYRRIQNCQLGLPVTNQFHRELQDIILFLDFKGQRAFMKFRVKDG